jgi:disulfide bond formation protein DsbB
MTEKKSLILLLCAAIFALTSAYISQFIFDYQPCILCLYQRVPFFAVIAVTSLALITKKFQKIAVTLCVISLLINCAIATYHVGVEQKIFAGPSTCSSGNLNDFDDLEDLKNALEKTKAVRCDEPQFFFLKLSMAGWNAIYCALLALYFGLNFKIRTNRLFTINKK